MIGKEALKELIPYGKYKEVAQRAGVSTAAVSKYLSGKIKSSCKIQKAAMEVAIEWKRELKALESELID